MALRVIRTDEDPVLRKISKPVKVFDEKLKQLTEDMIETMHEADGVGLAAVQIGVLKRIFVIEHDENPATVFINPEIVSFDGKQVGSEGCLSVPGLSGEVERPNYVKVRYQDIHGEYHEKEGTELFARAVFHENDHLNGKLYTDIANFMYDLNDNKNIKSSSKSRSGSHVSSSQYGENFHNNECGCGHCHHDEISNSRHSKQRNRAERRRR